ncbi:MAG: hypothetical protein HY898_12585 [Deltaproteobacteria bacterium]|nr:hypothetical protein [Deltaproteobacteria bacterium]
MALRWSFHDELSVSGHMAIIAEIQNGTYPPRYLSYPDLELAYHYAFNLLGACLTAIFRVQIPTAIDAISVGSWFYCWCLAWSLGDRLLGRHRGALVASLMLFGSGYPLFCPEYYSTGAPIGAHLLGFCTVGELYTSPPMVSTFFQHPWSMGLPVSLCIMTVLAARESKPDVWRYGVLALLTAFLSLCQITLFCAVSGSLLVAEALPSGRFDRRRALRIALGLALSVAVATQLGGFFAPKEAAGLGLEHHLWVASSFTTTLKWLLASFGLLLPLGLAGLLFLHKERWFYTLMIVGSLGVLNLVRYKYSWDIVKFAAVTSVALSVPFAALLDRLLRARIAPVLGRIAGTGALMATFATSASFCLTLLFDLPGIPQMYKETPPTISIDDARAATWLRKRVGPKDIVYRRKHQTYYEYASWAGLGQVWVDGSCPWALSRYKAREKLMAELPENLDVWQEARVRFFVLDDEDKTLRARAEQWIASGRAVSRGSFGSLWIVEIVPMVPTRERFDAATSQMIGSPRYGREGQ